MPFRINQDHFIRKEIGRLLEGYQKGFPFTKELLQNADDAGASHLFCGVHKFCETQVHPLLNSPGIFILNDGKFTKKDDFAIRAFDSSKNDQPEKVGRFGLGLKSVFHFCEAFFAVSSNHKENFDTYDPDVLINPWKPQTGSNAPNFHPDWVDYDYKEVINFLTEFVESIFPEGCPEDWFLIWVPIRSKNYSHNPTRLISNQFYCEDYLGREDEMCSDIFGEDLQNNLKASMPFLKNINRFQILGFNWENVITVVKDNHVDSNRLSISINEKNDFNGSISIVNMESESDFSMSAFQNGSNSILNESETEIHRIYNHEKWPSEQGERLKAYPHAAFCIIFQNTENQGPIAINGLNVKRCSFLPLSADSAHFGNKDVKKEGLTFLIHGYYFVDSTRTKVRSELDDVGADWNRALAKEFLAPHIIPEIAKFLNQSSEKLSLNDERNLINWLLQAGKTFFELEFALEEKKLIKKVYFSEEHQENCFEYSCVTQDQFPHTIPFSISKAEHFENLGDMFPSLRNLLKDEQLNCYLSKYPHTIENESKISGWNSQNLEVLFSNEAEFKLSEKDKLDTLIEFLHAIPQNQGVHEMVRKALAYSFQNTKPKEFYENWDILGKLSQFCGEDKVLYLNFKKLHDDLGEKLLEVFCKKSSEFIAFNEEEVRSGQNCFQVAESALSTILSWINEDPSNEKRKNKGADIALSVIKFCKPEERSSLLENHKLLMCNKWEDGACVKNLYSLNQVKEYYSSHQMLRKDYLEEHFARSIEQGCVVIPADDWPDFGNPKIDIFSRLETFLQENPIRLNEKEERKKLLSRSIQRVSESNVDANSLHRFFLHGVSEHFQKDHISLFEPSSSCWAKIARKLLEQKDECWKILNPEFLTQLSQEQKDILNIKSMEMNDVISVLIDNLDSIPSLDLSDLSEGEIIEIYDQSDLLESKSAELSESTSLFKLLPIHDSIENGLISIDEQTFLAEGSYPLPSELNNEKKFLKNPKNVRKCDILKRYVKPLDKLDVLRILLKQDSPTQYSSEIYKILKSHNLTNHTDLKLSVQSVAWNKLSEGGSAISLNKIFHPDYERSAKAIIQQAGDNLGYCTAKELQVPDGTLTEDFQKVVRTFCIQELENLNILKTICHSNNIFLGISYKIYSSITDGQDDEDTRNKKKAFFRRILGKKSIIDAISPFYPLVKVLSNIWRESKSILQLESFLGVKGNDQDLFGIKGTEETINVLNNLAEICGEGDNLKEDNLQTFLDYLKSSVEKLDTFKEQVLPNTPLLSANREWKNAQTLCKSDPTISTEFTVNTEVEECLPSDLPEANPLAKAEIIEETEILKQYFEPWMAFIPKPVLGGFISFLGDLTPGAKELAEKLLQTQTPDQVRTLIVLDEKYESPKIFHHKKTPISIASEQGLEATNILDLRIPVKSFAIGSIPNLFARVRKFFVGGEEEIRLELQFIPIEVNPTDTSQINQLKETFSNTWNCILRDNFGFNNRSAVDGLIEKLNDTSWVDIYFAQVMVFDGIFRYLRDKNFPNNSEMGKLTSEYNNRLKDKAYAKKNNDKSIRNEAEENFRKTEQTLNNKLRNILEDRSGALSPDAEFMISDVRNIINKHYQYTQESIPFEIFQNADDALLQLPKENRPKNTFELIENDNEIIFVHWGRPINSWSGTNLTKKEASERKYDEDLVKMLFLNSSAKNINANNNATGKFGVGFKSVYLICDKPKIISDGIDFEIVCGFYPRKLDSSEKDTLENQLPGSEKGRTAVVLEKSSISSPKQNLTLQFLNNSPFLPVFSRAVEEVIVDRADDEKLSLKFRQKAESKVYFYIGDILENESVKHRTCFFKLGNFGKLLLFFDGKVFSAIKNVSTFWVTVPTDVKLGLGFILNGPFHLDIGRASLHRDRSLNDKVIQDMTTDFNKGLLELWQHTENENIHTDYELWNSLWSLFAANLKNQFRDDEDQSGLDLIELLLWGDNQTMGYGWFIGEKRVLPNGIESNPKLLKKEEVAYKICSKLSDHLETIKGWDHLRGILDTSVSQKIERILNRFLKIDSSPLTFGLNELIFEDPVWKNRKEADKLNAKRLGSLFTQALIEQHDLKELEINPWKETKKTLSQIKFQSQTKQWKEPKELFCKSDNIEGIRPNLETLICGFAPEQTQLDEEIFKCEEALHFFKICRDGFREPSIETILEWCRSITTVEKKTNFCRFLLGFEATPYELCDLIIQEDPQLNGIAWLSPKGLRKFLESESLLEDNENNQLLAKLGLLHDEPGPEPPAPPHRPPTSLKELLYEFRKRKSNILRYYNEVFYPEGIAPEITDDWEDSETDSKIRKEWLKIFMASMTFRFGYVRPESTRNFILQCQNNGSLDTFANPDTEPLEWLNLLEKWIDHQDHSDQKFFQMVGCFPSFYKFSKYLSTYVRNIFTFIESDNSDSKAITKLGYNTELDGTGISAPMFTRDVSLGCHFIMAEFARITGVAVGTCFHNHCFLPKLSIKRYLIELGCNKLSEDQDYATSSQIIHDFLQEELGPKEEDYTFDYCYHIPLLLDSDERFKSIIPRNN